MSEWEWLCQKCGKPTRENADLCLSCAFSDRNAKVTDEPEELANYIDYKVWHMEQRDRIMNILHPPVPMNEDERRAAYVLAMTRQGVEYFQKDVSEWADRTFPGQTTESKLAHLEDELKELMAAPTDGEEMADCFILLCNIAQRAGVNLMEAAVRKMDKNRVRQWGVPDSRGVSRHVDSA